MDTGLRYVLDRDIHIRHFKSESHGYSNTVAVGPEDMVGGVLISHGE